MSAPCDRYFCLSGGLCVPIEPLQLLLKLEARGFQLGPTDDDGIWVRPFSQLTDEDTAGLRRWRHHLRALMAYRPRPSNKPTVVLTIAAMPTVTNTKSRPVDRVQRTSGGRSCSQRVLEFGTNSEGSNTDESRWSA